MSVTIERIEYSNYRQYGNGTIYFKNNGENGLTVFIAKNGTGKTTLLNSITWCLYEKETESKVDGNDVLPAISTYLIDEKNVGKTITATVKVIVVDDRSTIEFCRSLPYKIKSDRTGIKTIKGTSTLVATITTNEALKNTSIKRDADADAVVKQYFDESIYNFYFFDGEKLSDFFEVGRTKDIKNSIFNISQVSLLDNAFNHSEKIRYDLGKKKAQSGSELEELYIRRAELDERIADSKKRRDIADRNVKKYTAQIEEYDLQLRTYKPIQQLQEERIEKETLLKIVEEDEVAFIAERSDFLRKYLTLVNLYPRIQNILTIILRKEREGSLPPVIDSNLIDRILKNHEKECPLCKGTIDANAIEHLKCMLDSIAVSSATSNTLKEMKGPLEDYLDTIRAYPEIKQRLIDKEIDIANRKNTLEKRLKEISELLSGFGEGSDASIIAGLEKRRKSAIEKKDRENRTLGAAKQELACDKAELDSIIVEIKSQEKIQKDFKSLKGTLAVYDMLCKNFETIRNKIMNGMKKEISDSTWKLFRSMIWKKNTFGKIQIDDNYAVMVYDTSGNNMTRSMSATEQMALAYAFTLAIHEASGKNCPLVIDSPLGRVSDENRKKMAKELLKISKTKQIIMLFTPDEFSKDVRSVYTKNAYVSTLELSEDETFVQEVKES